MQIPVYIQEVTLINIQILFEQVLNIFAPNDTTNGWIVHEDCVQSIRNHLIERIVRISGIHTRLT